MSFVRIRMYPRLMSHTVASHPLGADLGSGAFLQVCIHNEHTIRQIPDTSINGNANLVANQVVKWSLCAFLVNTRVSDQ